MHDAEAYFEQNQARFIEEWKKLLSFPSVSSDPARHADCLACCHWLRNHLDGLGFAARELPTIGLPSLYAVRKGNPAKPVVLFYGHYDVQPADPLEVWTTPPFSPHIRGGHMFARGAQDNKGQHFYVLKALEALVHGNADLPTIKILLEGEEESGSRGMSAAVNGWKDLLAADILLVTDIGMHDAETPAITLGLRGLIHLAVRVTGPSHDLHSGMHGGVAPNPAQELARILATLHRADGRIAVPGYYDGIQRPSARERRMAAQIPFDARAYLKTTGVQPLAGETRLLPAERLAFRPSIDINGIRGGFPGPGVKTIIPSFAEARMTSRLPAGQNPARNLALLTRHLKKSVRKGYRLDILESGVGGEGFRLNPDNPWIRRASGILEYLTARKPCLKWDGASIPVITALSKASGAAPLLAGFGIDEDHIHAPNESFGLDRFRLGYRYAAAFLGSL